MAWKECKVKEILVDMLGSRVKDCEGTMSTPAEQWDTNTWNKNLPPSLLATDNWPHSKHQDLAEAVIFFYT